VRAAVLIAACRAHMDERDDVLRRCLQDGISLASDQTHISF
jgi:hypothetical protein